MNHRNALCFFCGEPTENVELQVCSPCIGEKKLVGSEVHRPKLLRNGPDLVAYSEYKWLGESSRHRVTEIIYTKTRSSGTVRYTPPRSARIFVRLYRDTSAGPCKGRPATFENDYVDRLFIALRARQVGLPQVGGTRAVTRGWYKGQRETALSYEVIFAGETEEGYAQFKKELDDLGQELAFILCQEEVVVVHQTAGNKDA